MPITEPHHKAAIKLPPQNSEAEQSVLGALLIDKNAILKVADVLLPDDFYNPSHERIFATILELYEKHQPIDILSVTNRLKEKAILVDVGGSGYLAELTNQVTTSSHVDHYAKIVKEKRILRDLIHASAQITEDAFDPAGEFEDLLDNIEQKILGISQKSLPKNFFHIREELKTAYERIEKLHEHKGALRGVPTGFEGLDNLLSGLQKSDLVILGARPSMGKTALALDIARHAAVKGFPVGIFSLEMSREQVIDRFISAQSGVPLWKLRTGRITDDHDFQLIQKSLDELAHVPLYIDDTPSPTILQMRSMGRRLQIEHGLALVIVDYLQLIMPRNNRSDNMVQQVTEISRGLKGLARELNIPILALSQLSRAVDQRDNKEPRLSDLRESGSIEQDADVVMFIHKKNREREDLSAEEQNLTEIKIAKHRNGPLGAVELSFNPELVTYLNIDKRHGVDPFSPDF